MDALIGLTDYAQREYESQHSLFAAQAPLVQRFLEAQARQLAEAIIQRVPQARFVLPDRVVASVDKPGESQPVPVPAQSREQVVGNWLGRLFGPNLDELLRQRLAELAQSPERAIAVSADLLRYATAVHMIYGMLPVGRSVTYISVEDEQIPTIPAASLEPESAITAATDAIVEEGPATEEGRGELQVPYAPAARRFYLPQWVAFDEQDRLLINSVSEAEAYLASMQRFVAILHAAAALAPYMVADPDYKRKRYGMLGQLINQGRALARSQTQEIILKIKARAATQSLNRGLRLSLPYFDDQVLRMDKRNVQVIPSGRIMFIPAFVVRASREEQAKVAQDTRLSLSTRNHLLAELKMLEQAFVA